MDTTNGGKVTTAEFYQALIEMRREFMDQLSNVEQRILSRIDDLSRDALPQVNRTQIALLTKVVDAHDNKLENLLRRSTWWDGVNSAMSILAGILGVWFGPKQ